MTRQFEASKVQCSLNCLARSWKLAQIGLGYSAVKCRYYSTDVFLDTLLTAARPRKVYNIYGGSSWICTWCVQSCRYFRLFSAFRRVHCLRHFAASFSALKEIFVSAFSLVSLGFLFSNCVCCGLCRQLIIAIHICLFCCIQLLFFSTSHG